MTRSILPDDLWDATRRHNMLDATRRELEDLIIAHEPSPAFASQVIAKAARQVIAARPSLRS